MKKYDKFWMKFAYALAVIGAILNGAFILIGTYLPDAELIVSSFAGFVGCYITYIGLDAAQRVGASRETQWWRHQDETTR